MTARRTIGVFTGNRAEYGLQFPVLRAISRHPKLEYRLIVSGAHLDKDFGRTLAEIEKDGFRIAAQVKMDVEADDLYATAQAIGSGVVSISRVLAENKPDLWLVYGDRFEAFAAAIAGTQMKIPTAHIEGGDITEGGALDDSVRHAITKLAHLHFTTNESAAERIRRMGEEAWRVHNVGFPAIDLIAAGEYAPAEEMVARYSLELDRPLIVFTQHSVATQFEESASQVRAALEALEILARGGAQVIITYPNNDAGGRAIIAEILRFAMRQVPNTQCHVSLGRRNYHGLLNLCGRNSRAGGACVGNSSSGIKETPAFGCPCVNIGSRQNGRLAAQNVINTGYGRDEIVAAAKRCLNEKHFIEVCHTCSNPYGVGDAGPKIADVLAEVNLGTELITKKMTIR